MPFAGVADLPVLGCTDLAVFKAFLARPKDAVDIAAMAEADAVDVELLTATLTGLLGSDSPNLAFVQDALGMDRRD